MLIANNHPPAPAVGETASTQAAPTARPEVA
jgi:hypothetical protein